MNLNIIKKRLKDKVFYTNGIGKPLGSHAQCDVVPEMVSGPEL
jgi:hypothetical protein